MKTEQLTKILSLHRPTLASEFEVKALYLFGSMAKKTNSKNSDVDILVEFNGAVGYFNFLQLKSFLESLLEKKIDLVTRDGLLPWMKESIEKDLMRVA